MGKVPVLVVGILFAAGFAVQPTTACGGTSPDLVGVWLFPTSSDVHDAIEFRDDGTGVNLRDAEDETPFHFRTAGDGELMISDPEGEVETLYYYHTRGDRLILVAPVTTYGMDLAVGVRSRLPLGEAIRDEAVEFGDDIWPTAAPPSPVADRLDAFLTPETAADDDEWDEQAARQHLGGLWIVHLSVGEPILLAVRDADALGVNAAGKSGEFRVERDGDRPRLRLVERDPEADTGLTFVVTEASPNILFLDATADDRRASVRIAGEPILAHRTPLTTADAVELYLKSRP